MSTGQLARTGVGISVLGIAFNQFELVGGILIAVGVIALTIRYTFRRGRTPGDH